MSVKEKTAVYLLINHLLRNSKIDLDYPDAEKDIGYIDMSQFDTDNFSFEFNKIRYNDPTVHPNFVFDIQKFIPLGSDYIADICVEWFYENIENIKSHDRVNWS